MEATMNQLFFQKISKFLKKIKQLRRKLHDIICFMSRNIIGGR